MLYQEHWDKIKERLLAAWNNEIIDRCCISVEAPLCGSRLPLGDAPENTPGVLLPLCDPEALVKATIRRFETTYFGGDCFPVLFSNFGPSGHAKYFKNAVYHFSTDTSWFDPSLNGDELNPDELVFDPESEALRTEVETVRYLAQEGKGKFFVSTPDNCGCIDALASLRGSSNLILDMMDSPDEVTSCIDKIIDGLNYSNRLFFDAIRENNEDGCCHGWMYTYSHCTHQQLQVDFSVMISPELYRQFALPELIKTSSALGYANYHLDGQEQVRHLDYILSVPNIKRIQWTPVVGQPRTSEHIPTLRRIQQAGKGLILYPEKDEVETLLTHLSSKGLMLVVRDAESREEADVLVRLAEKLTHE